MPVDASSIRVDTGRRRRRRRRRIITVVAFVRAVTVFEKNISLAEE